jgi:hypothetical protein
VRAWPLALCVALAAATSAPARAAEPTKRECVAANESGQDLRQAGKLREARAALAECMSPRCPRPVREDCAQRLADIEAALPTVVFVAKDGDGNDLRDVRVSMDGRNLAASDGTAVAIDPGDHAFTFTKEGFPPATSDIVVHEGDKNRRIQVVLAAPKPAPSETASVPPEPRGTDSGGKEKTGLFGLSPGAQRGIGLGVGIGGIVGLGVGTVFGILSKVTYDHVLQTDCHGQTHGCTGSFVADKATGEQQGDVSTLAFIAGGVLTAAGVVLYLETPTGPVSISPAVSAREAGVGLAGRF